MEFGFAHAEKSLLLVLLLGFTHAEKSLLLVLLLGLLVMKNRFPALKYISDTRAVRCCKLTALPHVFN